MKDNLPPIQHKLTELLAIRDHSQQELAQKLKQRGYETEAIAEVLAEFAAKDWLNDEAFAEQLVDKTRRKGQGPLKARHQLQQKGVSAADAEDAMTAMSDADWAEVAREAWQKKFHGQPPEDMKAAQKQWRFLAQRGFTQAHIRLGIPELHSR